MDYCTVSDLFEGLTAAQARQFRKLILPTLIKLRYQVVQGKLQPRIKSAKAGAVRSRQKLSPADELVIHAQNSSSGESEPV